MMFPHKLYSDGIHLTHGLIMKFKEKGRVNSLCLIMSGGWYFLLHFAPDGSSTDQAQAKQQHRGRFGNGGQENVIGATW